MSATRKPPQKPEPEFGGIHGRLKEVQHHGGETLAEVRDFLAQARGKSPQEFLGMVATSGLFTSTLASAVIIFLLIGVFTILPYLFSESATDVTNNKATAPTTNVAGDTQNDSASPTKAADPQATATATGDNKPAGDPLGITEVKDAQPDKNPLEGAPNLDKLLDID